VIRYAAPSTLTMVKISEDRITTADSPTAARVAWQ
jgi:hypothetical protein